MNNAKLVAGAARTLRASALSLLVSFLFFSSVSALEVGEDAPNFSLPSNGDEEVSLADFSGKVRFVDFWASWCAPCAKSLPWMEELQGRFPSEKFQVIALTVDEDTKAADRMLKRLGVRLLVGYDSKGKTAEEYEVPSMPSSYLIGADGKVLATYKSLKDSHKEEIISLVERSLGEAQ